MENIKYRKCLIKQNNINYLTEINDEFNSLNKKILYKNKILKLKEKGFITLKNFIKLYKININEKKILKFLNIQRMYILPDINDKIYVKKKNKNKKEFDPWEIDKEQIKKYGSNIENKCLRCQCECKQKKSNDFECFDDFKLLKNSFLYIRSSSNWDENKRKKKWLDDIKNYKNII